MTKLSPVAQAVRDAALATYDKSIPQDDNLWALDRASVVAALRAAADHFFTDWDATRCSVFLDAIADELEGADA